MNKWYKLKEKEPASGMACMVAYEFLWNGKKDTHYGRHTCMLNWYAL